MGYNETINQVKQIISSTGLTYLDNAMLHWYVSPEQCGLRNDRPANYLRTLFRTRTRPSCETGNGCGPSSDPTCNWGSSTYDDAACRLSSWRGLLTALDQGLIRSAGVSNFNISHLEELRTAGVRLPALNQISFYLYHSKAEVRRTITGRGGCHQWSVQECRVTHNLYPHRVTRWTS